MIPFCDGGILTIRDILKEDKKIFMEMAEAFYSSDAVSHNLDVKTVEANFDAAVNRSPFIRALIIEDGTGPVGFAFISFTHATEAGGLTVLLEDLYLNESCRGKGLGSKFINFVEQEYHTAKRFRLEVAKENTRAIELYKKLGYEELDYVQMVKEK
ncbi:MAG: GNAT family N-acetyltransferase [Defluviitaleaceae bacterium]|nr:GNAT family N-acetyltransferase [Defluviitaleaceae bacterium]